MGWLLSGKIAKIAIYDNARVKGGNHYDYPVQRWVPNLDKSESGISTISTRLISNTYVNIYKYSYLYILAKSFFTYWYNIEYLIIFLFYWCTNCFMFYRIDAASSSCRICQDFRIQKKFSSGKVKNGIFHVSVFRYKKIKMEPKK